MRTRVGRRPQRFFVAGLLLAGFAWACGSSTGPGPDAAACKDAATAARDFAQMQKDSLTRVQEITDAGTVVTDLTATNDAAVAGSGVKAAATTALNVATADQFLLGVGSPTSLGGLGSAMNSLSAACSKPGA